MADDQNIEIGVRVRNARRQECISLQQMAAKLPRQVSFQMLAQYESGKSRWPADLLSEVADVLRIDIRKLLGKI